MHRALLLTASLLLALSPLTRASEWFVSPSGNDTTGNGTLAAPFRTIAHAMATASPGHTITLRAGIYRETVNFTKSVTLRAYRPAPNQPAEEAIISALEPITGWSLDSGNIYQAPMNWELVNATEADNDKRPFIQHQVFFVTNGTYQPLVQARWPNIPYTLATRYTYNDVARMQAASGCSTSANFINSTVSWFTNDDTHIPMPASIRNLLPGALITYQPATLYFSRTNRIPSDPAEAFANRNASVTDEITIFAERLSANVSASTSNFSHQYDYPNAGCSYHVWGKKEFLDSPGEWFRQPTGIGDNGTLFVWMPDSAPPGNRIEAKRRMQTVIIGNMNEAENPAITTLDGIVLEDLTFLGGGITISRNSDNTTIRRCRFLFTSHLEDQRFIYTARWNRRSLLIASQNNLIEDCDFFDSENGIELNGRNNIVRNCVFVGIGANSNLPAVFSTFTDSLNNDGSPAQRNRVEHSTISLTALNGIRLHRGMNVFYNDVSGTHRRGNDVGAISAPPDINLLGIEVGYNWVHDSFPAPRDMANGKVLFGAHGIYTDRGTSNATFYRNVVWNVTGPAIAMLRTGNGSANSNRIVEHNTALGEISYEANTDTVIFRNNLQSNTLLPANNVTLTTNLRYSHAGAGWVNPSTNNYTLRPDSMAIDTGTILGNASWQQFTGAAPDAGAYEFGIPWPHEPGATLINGTLQLPSSITITPSSNRQTASVTLTGFNTPRKFPPGAQLRLATNSPSTAIRQAVSGTDASLQIIFDTVPLGNLTGTQAVQLSLDGGSTWQTLGNASIPPPSTTSLTISPLNPLSNNTLTIPRSAVPFAQPQRYQRTVTITNPSSQRLDYYPVLVTFDGAAWTSAGHLRPDAADLRASLPDGTPLPLWLESGANTTSTRVWVLMPQIPTSGANFLLTSGDFALPSASNGTAVFPFYDGFDNGQRRPEWIGNSTQTDNNGNLATVSVQDGQLIIAGNITNAIDWGAWFGVNLPTSNPSFYPPGLHILESRVQVFRSGGNAPPTSNVWKAHTGGDTSYAALNGGQIAFWTGSAWSNLNATFVSGGNVVTTGYAVDPGSGNGTGTLWVFENGQLRASRTGLTFTNTWNNPIGRGSWRFNPQAAGAFEYRVDDVRVRPWVPNEPTVSIGSPTTLNATILTAQLLSQNITLTWSSQGELLATLPALNRSYSANEILDLFHNGQPVAAIQIPWSTGSHPLEQWRYTHWQTIANSGNSADTADPDADGIPNLIEYALGGTPTSPASRPHPAVGTTIVSGQKRLTLTFTPQVVAGLTYLVQASNDLATWSDTNVTSSLTVGQPFTFTDTADLATTPRRFLRLRIEHNP